MNCTRRDVLKATAAALAFPYVLPARARARAAPSERITLGMIGVGNMGSGHVEGFLGNADVQIVAICDVDRAKRDKYKQKVEEHYAAETASGTYAGCEVYNEYEALLARRDIDAVLIAVPDHWHAIIAVAACAAGKDVYCEKPLSLTVREAEQMVAAARRYARVFQVGSQQRSMEKFRYACELVRNGRIGKLQTVHVGIGKPSEPKFYPEEPVPDGFDWDRWLGPAPWAPYNAERASGSYSGGWRLIRDYSGGMTTDWGAHHIDIAQWALGMDGDGPVEIHPPDPDQPESTDPASPNTLWYRYANGVTLYRGGANGVLFTGTEGTVEVNRDHFETRPAHVGAEPILPGEVRLYRNSDHRQNWIDCIRTRGTPICDVAIGASSITVCHLGNIASWVGRSIKWNPEKREILGDDAAARWLDRPKRAPWRVHA